MALEHLKSARGTSAVEYTILIAFVALGALAAYAALGDEVTAKIDCAARAIGGLRGACGTSAAAVQARNRSAASKAGRDALTEASRAARAPSAAAAARTGALSGTRGPDPDGWDPDLGAGRMMLGAGDEAHTTRALSSTRTTRTLSSTRTTASARDTSGRGHALVPLPPLALISMYEAATLPALIAAARRHHIRRPLYFGSYGVAPDQVAQVHALPNGRYAPMFKFNRHLDMEEHGGFYWGARRLTPEQTALLPAVAARRAGTIPSGQDLLGADREQIVAWGVELGRRFRDDIRRRAPTGVDAWQLDEIWPSACERGTTRRARRVNEVHRYMMAGAMIGLYEGRPQLGDHRMKGFVHIAHASELSRLDTRATRTVLWALSRTTLRVVGEEYPTFRRNARRVAGEQTAAQRRWSRSWNPSANQVARKYVAGMTPGHNLSIPELGGARRNGPPPDCGPVHGPRRACSVAEWQRTFVMAQRGRVAGIGMYNWTHGNRSGTVIDSVMGAVADGVR